MNTVYVLIVIAEVFYGRSTVVFQEFNDKASCADAARWIVAGEPRGRIMAQCFEKGRK